MTVRFGKDGPSWTRPLGQDQSRSPFKSCSRVSASDLFRMTIRAESPPSWCPAKRYVSDVHLRKLGCWTVASHVHCHGRLLASCSFQMRWRCAVSHLCTVLLHLMKKIALG